MGVAVSQVAPDHVKLADGTKIPMHCVVWGGGLMAAPVTAHSKLGFAAAS